MACPLEQKQHERKIYCYKFNLQVIPTWRDAIEIPVDYATIEETAVGLRCLKDSFHYTQSDKL